MELYPVLSGYIAQWLERLTADQQVPGSNPGVPSCNCLEACLAACLILAKCLFCSTFHRIHGNV